eukprot:TRINITY_DN4508_c0_g1_i1.p1 TRINITY_DN4508_c0_g1~~TRINITY_DN4508_c0_g1_i1.p1  ORF type:complete len:623 (-),score=108.18 TRINITY_DN4508_c0_g1_i1:141-2009(-)
MFPTQLSTISILNSPKAIYPPPFNPELVLFKKEGIDSNDIHITNKDLIDIMSTSPPLSTNNALSTPSSCTENNTTGPTCIDTALLFSSQLALPPTAPPLDQSFLLEEYKIDFNSVLQYNPLTSTNTDTTSINTYTNYTETSYPQVPLSPKLKKDAELSSVNSFFSLNSLNGKINLNDHASTPFIQCHLIAIHQLNKILTIAKKKGKIVSFSLKTSEIKTENGSIFQSELIIDENAIAKGLPGSSPFEAEGFACRCALDSFSSGSIICDQLNIKGLLVECCTKLAIPLKFDTRNLAANGLVLGPFQCQIYANDKLIATSQPMRSKVLAERCASQEALLHLEMHDDKPTQGHDGITKTVQSTTVNYKGSLNEFLSKIGVQQYRCEYVTTSNGTTTGPFQSKFLLDGREICSGEAKATKREAEQAVSSIALKKLIEEYNSRLEQIQPPLGYIKSHVILTPTDSNKVTNFKGMLFELLNKKNVGKFEFKTKGSKGDTVGPFSCTLFVNGLEVVCTTGHATKRAAEQTVSEIVLKQFGIGNQGETPVEPVNKEKLAALCTTKGLSLAILVKGTGEKDAPPLLATVLVDSIAITTTEQIFLSKIACEEAASKTALDILLNPSNVNNKR